MPTVIPYRIANDSSFAVKQNQSRPRNARETSVDFGHGRVAGIKMTGGGDINFSEFGEKGIPFGGKGAGGNGRAPRGDFVLVNRAIIFLRLYKVSSNLSYLICKQNGGIIINKNKVKQ